MAEVVQLHIESTIPELEQMERVGLFQRDEIKRIIRKRKQYEYKLQRRKKSKEDYLAYIQYEIGLLSIIKNRREKIGYKFKKKKIDYAIAGRINRLFKAVIYKFQDDPKLWLSHIEFCKKLGWTEAISGMFSRMLQVHNKNPSLWIAAAKWELEENNSVDVARNLLQRGLRFHPTSKLLWQEYYRMELMYVDQVRKRRQILGVEEQQKDEIPDAVLEGRIAMTVFDKAVEAITDVEFAISFLPICAEFDFTDNHQEQIISYLKKAFSDKEETWNAIARQPLLRKEKMIQDQESEGLKKREIMKRLEKKVCALYEEAINVIPSEKMWGLYIQFLLETLSQCTSEKQAKKVLSKVLKVMERSYDAGLLSMIYALEWIKLLHSCEEISKAKTIAVDVAHKWSDKLEPWLTALTLCISSNDNPEMINKLFEEALGSLPNKMCAQIWQLQIEWISVAEPARLESILENAALKNPDSGQHFKETYLEVIALRKGISAARKLYHKLVNMRPVTPSFFQKMIGIESSEMSPSVKRIRRCYHDALEEFGKENVDLWIKQIEFEVQEGNLEGVGKLYWQALKKLAPEKCDEFISRFTLLQTGYGNRLPTPSKETE